MRCITLKLRAKTLHLEAQIRGSLQKVRVLVFVVLDLLNNVRYVFDGCLGGAKEGNIPEGGTEGNFAGVNMAGSQREEQWRLPLILPML